MIRLIACDVDGTLVPDGTAQINTEIYDVIRRLKSMGVVFAVASGRQFASVERLFEPVRDEILYITDNGGFVRSASEVYSSTPLTQKEITGLVRDGRRLPGCDIMLCGQDWAYAAREDTPMFRWLRDCYRYNVRAVGDLTKPIDDAIVKLSVYHPDGAGKVCADSFTPKWSKVVKVTEGGHEWVDCMSLETNKGAALRSLQKRLGVTREETMAFGDNLNDLELLAEAKYSCAVGNAHSAVKQAASRVVDTNVNDGVLKTLRELLGSMG
ncbi:HAD family hydrolase [Feifania hominis]|uniref:HAD family phosphatase n=1 Tax=Feifania hominis TaxID=2763660 RepID=A0A926DBL3_9FIRM|nr:HAD family hydrolase [Feifania hominis]MBC8535975.1 HAD family phosphatase [Feifania hominis]